MPEQAGGYKTADLVLRELHTHATPLKCAMRALAITFHKLPGDTFHLYLSQGDIQSIREWLAVNPPPYKLSQPSGAVTSRKKSSTPRDLVNFYFR